MRGAHDFSLVGSCSITRMFIFVDFVHISLSSVVYKLILLAQPDQLR